ncbi:MAG: energy transducer TonB [Gemmatimonadaceae bacterium]|nr:energy transducer TonB [Gemmatimonadaceae bacterium]
MVCPFDIRARIVAVVACVAVGGLSACAGAPPAPAPTPAVSVADGCAAIRAEIAADPAAGVDQPATPTAMKPAPVRRPVPATVLRVDPTPELEVKVVVDTLGKPDMKSFAVVKSTHRWYTDGAKAAIGKWSFTPAMHRGCKVVRPYTFKFTSR